MDSTTTRRMPVRRERRIALNVSVSPETKAYLEQIGDGNRSAAVEMLVADYLRRRKRAAQPKAESIAEPA
jgi:hypothetical protein